MHTLRGERLPDSTPTIPKAFALARQQPNTDARQRAGCVHTRAAVLPFFLLCRLEASVVVASCVLGPVTFTFLVVRTTFLPSAEA